MNKINFTVIADPCASDEGRGTRDLIPLSSAIDQGLALAVPVGTSETVGLEDAIGRVLAQDLLAPFLLPPFDNSAMDGYALRSEDLSGNGPWLLRVVGRIAAGDDLGNVPPLGQGQACRIFTGAGIPQGADAVVMQEHVRRNGDFIELDKVITGGNCIRKQGEDAAIGSLLLGAGTLIGAREIGAIASVGLPQVAVHRKVRIALFCTGSELRQPGESLASGQIYNSNRFIMIAALRQPWIDLVDLGAIEDDPDRIRDTLSSISGNVDMIVTTGGVSVGEEDHMVSQLQEAGGQIEVMRIAMKPGKPLSVGSLGGAVFVGLPGNPVAAFTTWKVIGSRIAEKLAGLSHKNAPVSHVEVTQGFTRRAGREEFRPVRITGTALDGHPKVEMLDQSFSAKISMICKSDGFAVIPAATDRVTTGDRFEFLRL